MEFECGINKLPSKEEFMASIAKVERKWVGWSEPKYICPKCSNGGMCKNLNGGIIFTSNPPIYKGEYQCDCCGYLEYIEEG